nr:PD-(D/E)XK nuclease-like domain-containing protein [uncultured Cohaesibacter sp.]
MTSFDEQLATPIRIETGQTICEPGCYAIDIEQYHGQCCAGFSVSSSGLRLLEHKSPLHFWSQYIDPDREEDQKKPFFSIGQAAHTLFLGEQGFHEKFAIRPETYINAKGEEKPWNNNASACKDWNADQEEAGLYIITPSQLEDIKGMARMLARDPMIRQHGLLSGHIERSLIWQDRETGIWLKARPDVIPPIENTIVDLKTIGTSASDDDCQRAIGAHGYHMQLALVNMGMEAIFGRTVEEFILLFVETSAPYAYNLKPVDQRAIFLGECQIRRALRTLADCMERDHWPTYKGSGNHAYLPGWTQKTLEADLEGGLLPDVQTPITYGVAAE